MSLIRKAFARLHHPADVISRMFAGISLMLSACVIIEEIMVERGVIVDHSTLSPIGYPSDAAVG